VVRLADDEVGCCYSIGVFFEWHVVVVTAVVQGGFASEEFE